MCFTTAFKITIFFKSLHIYIAVSTSDSLKFVHTSVCGQIRITKTRLFKYIEKITSKNGKFSDKNSDIFLFSAQKHRLW